MSKSCYSRAGGWRKKADHYLTPEPEVSQDAAGAAVIQDMSSRYLSFLTHFRNGAGGRREKGGKEEWLSLADSAPIAKLSAERPLRS